MYFKKRTTFKLLAAAFILSRLFFAPFAFGDTNFSQIDSIRAELSVMKDKSSPAYIKTKQKLEKLITQNKIDYSVDSRLADIERLIREQKFNSATYELNDLIENGEELSAAYMLLGDIAAKSGKNPKKAAQYYKTSLQYDSENYLASYRLAKLYLREKRNILGIEYLKTTVENAQNTEILRKIEYIVQNKILPENKFEANNLYEILGTIYQKTGKNEESYRAFNRALQINPEDIFLKYYLGDLYFCNCEDKNAITIYDSILKENPSDSMIRITKAKALANTGNLLAADKEFRIVLNENPNSNQAKYGLYKLYERKLPADKILEKINANKPNFKVNQKECLEFAEVLDEMNDSKGAENFRRYASKLDEIEAREKIAKEKALEAEKLKQQKALEEKARLEQIAKNQKQAEIEKQKKEAEAKKAAEQKKTEAQKLAAAKKAEAEKLKQKQLLENKKAQEEKLQQEKMLEKKLLDEKKQQEYENRAIAQERERAIKKDSKKYNEYKAVVDKYMKISPKDAATYTAIANTYKMMGEPTSALKYYKEAQKLNPADSDIYYNLGLTYMELNSFITAKANLVKSVNLNKENAKAIKLLAFVNQKIVTNTVNNAYSEFEKKNYIKASEILDEGIKNYPRNAQLLYYRALVYDAMNRNAAQIIDLQKAIEFDPGYYMAYYQLGHAYEKINDERSALVAYEKFLSTEPEEKDLIDEIQKKVVTLGQKYY